MQDHSEPPLAKLAPHPQISGSAWPMRSEADDCFVLFLQEPSVIHTSPPTTRLCAQPFTTDGGAATVGSDQQMWDSRGSRPPQLESREWLSVGGYLAGGGHSILSPRFVVAADHLGRCSRSRSSRLKGELVTANEYQTEDLFWALRGASEFCPVLFRVAGYFTILTVTQRGCSTSGVIASATMKTLLFAVVTPSPASNSSAVVDLNAFLLGKLPSLMDAGISEYTTSHAPQCTDALPLRYIRILPSAACLVRLSFRIHTTRRSSLASLNRRFLTSTLLDQGCSSMISTRDHTPLIVIGTRRRT